MKTLAWLIAIMGGGVLVLFQQRTRVSLEQNIAELASTTAEVSRLTREREHLLAQQPTPAELELLQRNQTEAVRFKADRAPGPESRTDAVSNSSDPYPVTKTGSVFDPKRVATSDLKLKTEWRNVGNGTPAASFETYCWAEERADLDVMLTTLLIDNAARAKAQQLLDAMPAEQRAKFGTPEQFIAALRVGSATPFEGIKVLDVIERAPGQVVLRTLWQYGDGRVRENTNLTMTLTSSGWKWPIAAGQVEQQYKLRMSGWTPGIRPPAAPK